MFLLHKLELPALIGKKVLADRLPLHEGSTKLLEQRIEYPSSASPQLLYKINKTTRSLNIFVRKTSDITNFLLLYIRLLLSTMMMVSGKRRPKYKGKERKNNNVCLPYKLIFKAPVILFIMKLYARVNTFRPSENLQTPP